MNSDQIEIEVAKPKEWSRVLKIKVSVERIESERGRVTQSLRKKAKIPGFRHGKAPLDMVSRHFKGEIGSETLEAVINNAVEEALEKEDLNPITKAAVENINYEDGKPLEFEARFDIQPEINLNRYTSFKLKKGKVKTDDDEVDVFIKNLQEQNATFPEVDRPAKDGDLVTIDYTPMDKNRTPLVKQKVTDVKVLLGDHKILPEIETQLYGKGTGEEVEAGVEYPEDYQPTELRGKKRNFLVSIKSVGEKKIPDLNGEFVKSLGDFSDTKSFKLHVRDEILKQKEKESSRNLEEELIDNIIEANPFEVPESMVDVYISNFIRSFEGQSPEAEDMKKVDEKIRPIAEREVKKTFIIDIILKKEKLEPSADEVENEVERLAVELGKDPKELKTSIMANPEDYNRIRQRLANKKVFEFLVNNSKISTE
jgi:trigger factor